jgi:hypothetical protein
MGFLAGYVKDDVPLPVAACALIAGHLLNIILYVIAGLMPQATLATGAFWLALLYEAVLGVIVIVMIITIFRMIRGSDA